MKWGLSQTSLPSLPVRNVPRRRVQLCNTTLYGEKPLSRSARGTRIPLNSLCECRLPRRQRNVFAPILTKRGAIQLTMGFLVTIIISIVLLALGILFLRQLVTGAEEIKLDLDQQTESQLASLLDQGQQIAIPFNTQTIRRGNSHIFGIGILNIQEQGIFELSVTLSKAVDTANNEFPAQTIRNLNIPAWLRYDASGFQLNKNERQSIPLLIQIPTNAPSGTYIFNVQVKRNNEQYDTTKKIYVIVP